MREQAAKFPFLIDCRYTIIYNEWTCHSFATASIKSIHSHIQWGNRKAWLYADKEGDTPSHIMRELQLGQAVTAAARYTLTYSEGTCMIPGLQSLCSIYPHIQWGNLSFQVFLTRYSDIPSHTVRERLNLAFCRLLCRYTLTYSEGTWRISSSFSWASIYPHIQWGNAASRTAIALICDIPSHTVREQSPVTVYYHPVRYTLTYSEGTVSVYICTSCRAIYPHIQWGNERYERCVWS